MNLSINEVRAFMIQPLPKVPPLSMAALETELSMWESLGDISDLTHNSDLLYQRGVFPERSKQESKLGRKKTSGGRNR